MGQSLVADRLPELLVWLQDMNWPGATIIERFLLEIGEPVVPHVREVLRGSDRVWQYWILGGLVAKWPRDMVVDIEPELIALVYADREEEGVDLLALRILAIHGLDDHESLERAVRHKRWDCEQRLEALSEIETCLGVSD